MFNKEQIQMLYLLPKVIKNNFVFSGGTALSEFYLQHRYSYDLDFFAMNFNTDIRLSELKNVLQSGGFAVLNTKKKYDRCIFFISYKDSSPLKIEFVPLYFKRINPPCIKNDYWVDSLEDLSASKLIALTDRANTKDLIDLYFINKETDLGFEQIIELAKIKYDVNYNYLLPTKKFISNIDLNVLDLVKEVTMNELYDFLDKIVDICKNNISTYFQTIIEDKEKLNDDDNNSPK